MSKENFFEKRHICAKCGKKSPESKMFSNGVGKNGKQAWFCKPSLSFGSKDLSFESRPRSWNYSSAEKWELAFDTWFTSLPPESRFVIIEYAKDRLK